MTRPDCPTCGHPMPHSATRAQPESESDTTGKRLFQCVTLECPNRKWYGRDGSQVSPDRRVTA